MVKIIYWQKGIANVYLLKKEVKVRKHGECAIY